MSSLPPYAQLLKVRIETHGEWPVVAMRFHDDVVGRPGYLHGGAIAGLLEIAAFSTLGRALRGEEVAMKPIGVTVDYMRGGTDRETYAAARIERLGKRIANVEASAWQDDRSNPIATARINFLLDRGDL